MLSSPKQQSLSNRCSQSKLALKLLVKRKSFFSKFSKSSSARRSKLRRLSTLRLRLSKKWMVQSQQSRQESMVWINRRRDAKNDLIARKRDLRSCLNHPMTQKMARLLSIWRKRKKNPRKASGQNCSSTWSTSKYLS